MHDNDSLVPESFELPRPQGGAKSPDEAIMGPAFTLMDAGLLGGPGDPGHRDPREHGEGPFGQTTLEPVPEAEPLRLPFEEPIRHRSRDEWSMLDQESPYPSGGGAAAVMSLLVQEVDGTPSINVATLKVRNGCLTDEGNGTARLNAIGTESEAMLTPGHVIFAGVNGLLHQTSNLFWENTTNLLYVNGDVSALTVSAARTFTDTDNTVHAALYGTATHSPTADVSGTWYACVLQSYFSTASQFTNLTGCIDARVTQLGTGQAVNVRAVASTITKSTSGILGDASCFYARVQNNHATNAIQTGYGVRVDTPSLVGAITTYYAFYAGVPQTGSVTTAVGLLVPDMPVGTNRYAIYTLGGNIVFNESGGNNDVRMEGDFDQNLFFLDASVDRIGIGTSAPQVKLDVSGGIATRATTNATITADQNDYAIGAASFFRLATDAQRTITGLTGGADGKLLVIRNTGSFNLVLAHNSGSSAAANRILTGTGEDVVVPPDAAAILIYDATTQRWQMV